MACIPLFEVEIVFDEAGFRGSDCRTDLMLACRPSKRAVHALCIDLCTDSAIFAFQLVRLTVITAEVGFDCTLCDFPERGVVWMAKPTRVITPFSHMHV